MIVGYVGVDGWGSGYVALVFLREKTAPRHKQLYCEINSAFRTAVNLKSF